MHKRRLNELTIQGLIQPDGPILIKSGLESGADPTLPAMNFVRSRHPRNGQTTIYLPGSSLKGTIRSHVERIIQTVHPRSNGAEAAHICCDPFSDDSCGKRVEEINKMRESQGKDRLSTAAEYRELCLACRIFGHMSHASHFVSTDAYPLEPIDQLPMRHGVAINRFSGAAQGGALFEMEVAERGSFGLRIMLTNFELWQVGLLALALRDMNQGRLLIGFGKSRGLGKVSLNLTHLEVGYPGQFDLSFDPAQNLVGAASLAPDMQEDYDWVSGEDRIDLPEGGRVEEEDLQWGRPNVKYGTDATGEALKELAEKDLDAASDQIWKVLAASVPAWASYQKAEQNDG